MIQRRGTDEAGNCRPTGSKLLSEALRGTGTKTPHPTSLPPPPPRAGPLRPAHPGGAAAGSADAAGSATPSEPPTRSAVRHLARRSQRLAPTEVNQFHSEITASRCHIQPVGQPPPTSAPCQN